MVELPAIAKQIAQRKPGLFITGTDTGVGKTVVTCGIAAALARTGVRVGVSKPVASGCRRDREGLVSDDTEALAYYARTSVPLNVITPICYAQPLAPAVAAEALGQEPDWNHVAASLSTIHQAHDLVLVEGVGGVLVPLSRKATVLDLIVAVNLPVVIVARSTLGTLNHTAMTALILRQAGVRVAGVIMNSYDADLAAGTDPSVGTNRLWIERMTSLPVLATVPKCRESDVAPHKGKLPLEIVETLGDVDWSSLMAM